jgi:hypothetical protein
MIRRLCCTGALALGLLVTSIPAAHAASVSPSKWAPKFCTALDEWQTTISDKGDAMTTELASVTDLETGRDQIAAFLGDMVDATDKATKAIKAAGAPKSPNGAKISAVFVNGFKAISKEFAKAQTKAEELPTTSPEAFKVGGEALGKSLSDAGDELGKGFGKVDKLDKGGKLEKAVKAAPACAFLNSSSN